jgi:ABC-2 type transport system permease protein
MSFLKQTNLVFARSLRLSLRNPIWVVIGLIQPLLYLVLFGPLLKRIVDAQGFPSGDAWQVFVPGLLVQLGLFGALFVGFGLIAEMRAGVIERERVTPISRAAMLCGRVLRDVVVLLVQALLLTGAAMLFGLSAPVGGLVLGILVVGLLGAAFSSLSYTAGLLLKEEDALAPLVNMLAVPLLLLSGILLPMSLAPGWLQTISDFNPLKHVVSGIRVLFLGDVNSTALWGLVAAAGIVGVSLAAGVRAFQRASA